MKTILVIATSVLLVSCGKSYVCECTDHRTGEKSYGDTFRGPLQKKSAQIACDEMVNKVDTTSTCVLVTK